METDQEKLLPHPPPPPSICMLVDRTSFDETDDFDINPAALESPDYPSIGPVKPIVMKSGKVRRRLRWRPKSMMKRRRPTDMSVASITSRTSRKSVHSFASTETMQQSNTRKSKNAIYGRSTSKFPLPRPNYPDHFNGVSTIGTEGGMVHARMTPERIAGISTVLRKGQTMGGKLDEKLDNFDPYQSPLEPTVPKPPRKKKSGALPPLFQQATTKRKVAASSSNSPEVTPEPKSKGESSPSTPATAALSFCDDLDSPGNNPLPALSENDVVEGERQVDLRILRTPVGRRNSFSSFGSKPTELTIPMSHSTPERQEEKFADSSALSVSDSYLDSLEAMGSDDDLSKGEEEVRFPMSNSLPPPPPPPPSEKTTDTTTTRPRSTGPVDVDEVSLNDDDDTVADELVTPTKTSSAPKTRTGPVDLDDGTFVQVQVEKNLQAIHEMATEHLQQGEYTEALEVFEEILRGQLARYGENHYRVGTAYHNIGIVQTKRGHFTEAVQAYKEAIRIRQSTLKPFHPDVGVSLAHLGVAYLEMNKHRRALVAFRESLKIRRRCYGNRHPKVAKILNNIGCALYELDELEVAQVAFEEALVIQRALLRDMPTEQADSYLGQLLGIASTQSNLASIKLIHGEHDDAAVDLEEALLVQQCVLSDDHPIVQRTQESLVWIEDTKISPLGMSSSVQMSGSADESCLVHTPRMMKEESRETRGPSESPPSVMDLLEERFMALRAKLDFACGGEGDVLSEDEFDDESSGSM